MKLRPDRGECRAGATGAAPEDFLSRQTAQAPRGERAPGETKYNTWAKQDGPAALRLPASASPLPRGDKSHQGLLRALRLHGNPAIPLSFLA